MTSDSIQRRSQRRRTALVAVRIGVRGAATAAGLLAAYFLAPVRAKTPTQEVLWLVAALAAFVVVIGLQVRAIAKSRHPQWRAIESIAVAIPLFLIVFARIYLTVSSVTSHAFSVDLDRTRALYFTITVFSTVGFGDISPQTDFARWIVSVQMLLDLVVLGAIVRVLFGAAERGAANREPRPGDRAEPAE
ncbi:MAG TPA: potassium channel family protein [Jatrophihabitans sp.]|nr:potassium channel family protein [Jatrophihabitans sp.]